MRQSPSFTETARGAGRRRLLAAALGLVTAVAAPSPASASTAFVTNQGSNSVTPIDVATGDPGVPIDVATSPLGIDVSPDGTKAYVVGGNGNGTLTPIDVATLKAGPTLFTGGNQAYDVAFTPDSTYAFVTNSGSGTPYVGMIDVAAGTSITTITVGTTPRGVVVSHDGKTAYVANSGSGTVTPIDVATRKAGTAFAAGSTPYALAITPDDKTLYVANNVKNGTVTPITLATRTAGTPVATVSRPQYIAVTPGGPAPYIVSAGGGITVAPDGATAYNVNPQSNSVTPITIATGASRAPIAVGSAPRDVAFSTLSVVTPSRLPGMPAGLSAARGDDGNVGLSWSPPVDDGNRPISGYVITPYVGGVAQSPITTSTAATRFVMTPLSGLSDWSTYTFTVAAVNMRGTGTPTAPVSPHAAAHPAAPTGLTATPGDGQVTLSWTAPADDGGRDVGAYVITPQIGGVAQAPITTLTPATRRTVTGLHNGTAYTFTVAALNVQGAGPGSDAAAATLAPVPGETRPPATVYMTTYVGNSVVPIDDATGAVGTPIGVPSAAPSLALSADGNTAYVASENNAQGTVTAIDVASGVAGTPIKVGGTPVGIALAPDGHTAYVTAGNTLLPVDVVARTVKPAIQLPGGAHGVVVTPDGRTAYVATGGSVTPVDLATATVKDEIPIDGGTYDLAITPDGRTVYVVSNSRGPGFATAIDVATNTVRKQIPVGSDAQDIAVSPDGKLAYVVNLGPDYVTPIDVATDTSGAAIPVLGGWNPQTVAFTPDSRTAYVAGGGRVAVVDVASARAVREIDIGGWSYDLAVSPVQGPLPASASDPTITLSHDELTASLGDPTSDSVEVDLTDRGFDPAALTVTATDSSRPAIAAPAAVTVSGTGATRTVSVTPAGATGTTDLTLKVTAPDGKSATTTLTYGVSGATSSPATSRFHSGASDASTAIDAGGGYMLLADDETAAIRLYRRDASGQPLRSWDFRAQVRTDDEFDMESSARVGDTIYWMGSMGNNKNGKVQGSRQLLFTTTIHGTGANTQLAFGGVYSHLREDLVAWDQANGDAFGLAAATGGVPKRLGGFNVEGLEFAPGSTTTAYIGFRAPLVPPAEGGKALVVPLTNIAALVVPGANDRCDDSDPSCTNVRATFGPAIQWDLGGLTVREIRKNAADQYLIIGGSYTDGGGYALFDWDGVPAHAPVRIPTALPADYITGRDPGAWESIVSVPTPLVSGADVQLVMDDGTTDYYGDGQAAKDLSQEGLKKSRSDHFTLTLPNLGAGAAGGSVPATLALSLGAPASFGALAPGVARDYAASTTANVISTAGDAALTVADPAANAPGHLVNGAFALSQPVQARVGAGAFVPVGGAPATLLGYGGPVSNDPLTIDLRQSIGAGEPLRTGAYTKALVFTLSTTTP